MDDLLSWFRLKSVPGIGNHLIKRLIDRFDSPDAVFNASGKALLSVKGMSRRLVAALRDHAVSDHLTADVEQALAKGYQVVPMTDPAYPVLLRQIPDPPPYLYVHGRL